MAGRLADKGALGGDGSMPGATQIRRVVTQTWTLPACEAIIGNGIEAGCSHTFELCVRPMAAVPDGFR